MKKSNEKFYSTLIRNCCKNADDVMFGIMHVLDKGVLNGTSCMLKDKQFRKCLKNLLSYITDLSQKQLPLDKAKSRIKMCLANNRRIVEIVDAAFEDVGGDAPSISFKKTYLISPAMTLRKELHEAMTILEEKESE